jgi:hypothetical protein
MNHAVVVWVARVCRSRDSAASATGDGYANGKNRAFKPQFDGGFPAILRPFQELTVPQHAILDFESSEPSSGNSTPFSTELSPSGAP